jgi:tRNA nucleotidyltransferase (CCA-adding enzyme)
MHGEPQAESVGGQVLERLRAQAGARELLELAQDREDIELVGGAVRDLLLGRTPRELDLVVAADAPGLAAAVAARLGTEAIVHERFGTALVQSGPVRLDFATRRAESYPAPGALPQVRAGTPAEDLLRRDFTVNAIALALGGSRFGSLRAVSEEMLEGLNWRWLLPLAPLEDLRERRLRVLHEQSFLDDPTRLLRLVRYQVRLGFAVEQHTAELARAAVHAGALATVSGARVGAELRLALAEPCAPEVLEAMNELGYERPLVQRALTLLPADGSVETLLLSVLILPLVLRADGQPEAEARALLDRLEFSQAGRERTLSAAMAIPRLREELARCQRPSQLYALAQGVPLEGVALAGALADAGTVAAGGIGAAAEAGAGAAGGIGADAGTGAAGEIGATVAAERWLNELRHVRLQISGADLLAAGIPQGPEIGRRLESALCARLDGELAVGREAELCAALEA